jgi:hypothetical protein
VAEIHFFWWGAKATDISDNPPPPICTLKDCFSPLLGRVVAFSDCFRHYVLLQHHIHSLADIPVRICILSKQYIQVLLIKQYIETYHVKKLPNLNINDIVVMISAMAFNVQIKYFFADTAI